MGVTGDHPFILGVESNTRRLVSEPARAGQTQVIFQHGLLPDTAVIDVLYVRALLRCLQYPPHQCILSLSDLHQPNTTVEGYQIGKMSQFIA
jgi:hypothetical protein